LITASAIWRKQKKVDAKIVLGSGREE